MGVKKWILTLGLALAVLAASAFGAPQKITCRVTGKKVDQCRYEMKSGKFSCPFTMKTYDQRCCDIK